MKKSSPVVPAILALLLVTGIAAGGRTNTQAPAGQSKSTNNEQACVQFVNQTVERERAAGQPSVVLCRPLP